MDNQIFEHLETWIEHQVTGDGGQVIEYYTLQPAPTQWVAVGRPATATGRDMRVPALVVGTGSTEAGAIADLRDRCDARAGRLAPMVRLERDDFCA